MPKGLKILIILVAVFGAAIAFEIFNLNKDNNLLESKLQIFTISEEQMSEIAFSHKDQNLVFKKSTENWEMTSPVRDLADLDQIEELKSLFKNSLALDVAKEGASIDLNLYGLNLPEGKIQIKSYSGEMQEIVVSNIKNFEQNIYIMKPNTNLVLVASAQFLDRLTRPVFNYRSKVVFRHNVSDIESFQIQNSRGQFKIVKEQFSEPPGYKWVNSADKKIIYDASAVQELLKLLSDAKITEYTSVAINTSTSNISTANASKAKFFKLKIQLKSQNENSSNDWEITVQELDKKFLANSNEFKENFTVDYSTFQKLSEYESKQLLKPTESNPDGKNSN